MIPKTFHFIWIQDSRRISFTNELCIASQMQLHPDYEFNLWVIDPKREFEKPLGLDWDRLRLNWSSIYPKELLDDIELFPDPSHKSDLMRMYILNKYGGVYSDLDSLAIRPLPPKALLSEIPIFGVSHYEGDKSRPYESIDNGFFISPANSEWLQLHYKNYVENYQSQSLGFGHLSTFLPLSFYSKNLVKLWSQDSFSPLHCRTRDTFKLFMIDRFNDLTENTYQIHLYDSLCERFLKHMNLEHINNVDTTFTKAVRNSCSNYLKSIRHEN